MSALAIIINRHMEREGHLPKSQMIKALCKKAGKTPPANLDGMGKREASQLIDRLMKGDPDDGFEPVYTDEEPF